MSKYVTINANPKQICTSVHLVMMDLHINSGFNV